MEKKKSYTLLIVSAVLLIAGIVLAIVTHENYLASLEVEDKAEKLSLQRPYSYSLALVFLSVLFLVKGCLNAFVGVAAASNKKTDINRLAQASLMAALCYVGFAVFKIDVPVPGAGNTAFHFGNVFCVLGALLLGGYWGGLAGAVGMTIADLTTAYVTSAPKTFLLKLLIGLIVGAIAHKLFKLGKDHKPGQIIAISVLASACGMAFNVVADPVVGYFYKTYLLGIPQDLAAAFAKINAGVTAVNAVLAVIFATIFYMALRPALKRAGLLVTEEKG